jgi:hypothetical protein
MQGWDPNTPVAYWDAADVYFQSSLVKLWELVRANSAKLLAVQEPKSHPEKRRGRILDQDDSRSSVPSARLRTTIRATVS